jgi:hypothetical protein
MTRNKMDTLHCEAFKETVKKETSTRKFWEGKYGRDKVAQDRQMLLESLTAKVEQERERQKREAASPERKLLYEGVSKEGKGRMAYLMSRRSQSPKQKSQRPLTSSQEVGWLSENHRSEVSVHGRRAIVADTFYRSHGIN